jgi:protein-disulfide isomerase
MIQRLFQVGLVLLLLSSGWAAPIHALEPLDTQILEVIRSHPQEILDSLIKFQQQESQNQSEQQSQRLQEVTHDRKQFLSDSPGKGRLFSQKTIVEFSDFQCPFCKQAKDDLLIFAANHPEIRIIYKNLPLIQIHDQAMPSAKAAWAAGRQGKFWQYHDDLFSHQEELGESLYQTIAQNLKLDIDRFNHDRESQAVTEAIEADIKQAEQLDVTGTPFFLVLGPKEARISDLNNLELTIGQV